MSSFVTTAPNAPCALTIGNFDGVHLGHQAILTRVRQAAASRGLISAAMTFEPHPQEYLTRLKGPPYSVFKRICTVRDKLSQIRACGIQRVHLQRFNQELATMSAEYFVTQLLVKRFQTRWLLVGADFRFGHQRRGDVALLRELGQRHQIEVVVMDEVIDATGRRVASSDIRHALAAGDLALAQKQLGRTWSISGHVLHGRQLGRTLGFPTLNLRPPPRCAAHHGVYVVHVHGLDAMPLAGVANLGVRPTVDQQRRELLEVHVLTNPKTMSNAASAPRQMSSCWSAYGKLVQIEFFQMLRHEQRFDDLAALKAAIAHDVQQARTYFTTSQTPSQ